MLIDCKTLEEDYSENGRAMPLVIAGSCCHSHYNEYAISCSDSMRRAKAESIAEISYFNICELPDCAWFMIDKIGWRSGCEWTYPRSVGTSTAFS